MKQILVINGDISTPAPATSRVLEWLTLGSIIFFIYDDLNDKIVFKILKFAENTISSANVAIEAYVQKIHKEICRSSDWLVL